MPKSIAWLPLILILVSCSGVTPKDQHIFDDALNNGILSHEGYTRCLSFVNDWLNYADPESGLIPENLSRGIDVWSPYNSAADNYPFMVLTSYLLDEKLYQGRMLDILKAESRLTSRLKSLPDNYSFSKQGFTGETIDTSRIIFGTSEYIKDGLIPISEYMGITPWSDRMLEMLDDLLPLLDSSLGRPGVFLKNSSSTEINGELLQTISRVYWMTGDDKYLNWGSQIANFYLLDNPDFLLNHKKMRLRDHGCEIIGGLSEFYVIAHYKMLDNRSAYQQAIYALFDRILEIGRNADGMFYNVVNMESGELVNKNIVDNWGYLYNAYYTLYLIDHKTEYRDAVLKPFKNLLPKYSSFNWESGSSDGFADAIESGINIYNRESSPDLKEWIDNEIKVMWSLQDSSFRGNAQQWKNRGIIEGWHGDGNFARTTLMYCLWKTQGLTLSPWREDVILGAELKGDELYITLKADEDWEGILNFGQQRHKEVFNLPLDYPRINQFPEWFTVQDEELYRVKRFNSKVRDQYYGSQLKEGIKIRLAKGKPLQIIVKQ